MASITAERWANLKAQLQGGGTLVEPVDPRYPGLPPGC